MTSEEFEEFLEVAKEVGYSYAVSQWPERFDALLLFYAEMMDSPTQMYWAAENLIQ